MVLDGSRGSEELHLLLAPHAHGNVLQHLGTSGSCTMSNFNQAGASNSRVAPRICKTFAIHSTEVGRKSLRR